MNIYFNELIVYSISLLVFIMTTVILIKAYYNTVWDFSIPIEVKKYELKLLTLVVFICVVGCLASFLLILDYLKVHFSN